MDIEKTLSFKTNNEVDNILKSTVLFDNHIKYFTYIRLFKDGTRICLSNTNQWTKTFHENYFSIGMTNRPYDVYESGFVFFPTHSEQSICQIMREHFNIAHGILLIERQKEACEISLFATNRENYFVNNFYINNLDYIKRFVLYFKDKCHHLIQQADSDRLIFPKCIINNVSASNLIVQPLKLSPEDYKNFRRNNPINRFYMESENNQIYLTQKELDCVFYLVQGKSAKEIADFLQIMPKTVETHLANIRNKLGAYNKSAVIAQLLEFKLININSV